jgi:DNA polymerase IV
MDCFYAAVEMLYRPELEGRPVAVGGSGRRGVLTTCNYEARKFGCRSAMPGWKALELCPGLVMLPVNFDRYVKASQEVRKILSAYSNVIEPLSLDEAFLDVSEVEGKYAWQIAREIRERIRSELGLTASAGVAPNKMLAKIASDWRKPDGQYAILPGQVDAFMKELPVGKLWGVGVKTRERLGSLGITNCAQLQGLELSRLMELFGKFGADLYHLCRGIDDREVVVSRERKSMSIERTLPNDMDDIREAASMMSEMGRELMRDLAASKYRNLRIGTVFVKLKFSDFRVTTRACASEQLLEARVEMLLREAWLRGNGRVRLLGVGVRFAQELACGQTQMELGL